MTIIIIDYGSGNLRSVAKAFEQMSARQNIIVTSHAQDLVKASHIVLPGVGAFADCMRGLSALDGMLEALNEAVLRQKKNFLGICVGMQMMFETGHEHGAHKGLGWLKGEVVMLRAHEQNASVNSLKIPHMGWNTLTMKRPHPLMNGIQSGDHAYFVHSYHAQTPTENIIATTHYGQEIAAVVGSEHMLGTQFHPEKSQKAGLRLIQNFMAM